MKLASVAELKARLSEYLRESRETPVVVTRNGRPVALLLSVNDDDDLEHLILSHSPRLRAILEKSKQTIAEMGGVPHEQFWSELDTTTKSPSSAQ